MSNAAPRKKPRQPRAHNTVKRILVATAALVEETGVETVTTNAIAERAGVNIASLYQYFPNKEAVMGALLESYFQEMTHSLNDLLLMQADMPLAESTRLWSYASLAFFRSRPGLLAILMHGQQQSLALPSVKLAEYRLMEAMRRFLLPRRAALEIQDLELAVQVAFVACTAVLHRHLLDPLPYHSDAMVVEEVVRLLTGYFGTREKQ